jgi:hypothetical protein
MASFKIRVVTLFYVKEIQGSFLGQIVHWNKMFQYKKFLEDFTTSSFRQVYLRLYGEVNKNYKVITMKIE